MTPSLRLLKEYLWLLDLLNRTGGLTREQINTKWANSYLNEEHESAIPERTFHRHKDAIQELFGIEIICDRSNGHVYRIANWEEQKDVMKWVLNAFSVNNMLQSSQKLSGRIIFEEIPSGYEYLTEIINAMEQGKTIEFIYSKFGENPHSLELEPYCLKVSAQRWYVTGRNNSGNIRTYGLDRIECLNITDREFAMPADFDVKEYFAHCVGVTVNVDKPERVDVLIQDGQQHYVRSLPLHESQTEIEKEADYSIFSYYVRPSTDFEQSIKKYGSSAIVLRPQWLRDQMVNDAQRLLETYAEENE